MRTLVFTAIASAVLCAPAVAQTPTQPPPCLDFSSQQEAQDYFEGQGGPERDELGLDADDNGRACDEAAAATPTSTATSPVTTTAGRTTPEGVTTTAVSGTGLAGRIGPLGFVGLGLAALGLAALATYLLRRRTRLAPTPPPPAEGTAEGWYW